MYSGNRSRIVPTIVILLVIAVAIAALVSAGRAIFGGNSTPQTDTGREALLSTASTSMVRMTVRGPIVADENFRSYQITVDPSSRVMTAYSGYLDQAIDSQPLTNNQQAYTEFVYALDKAGMMNGKALQGDKDDTRGMCATGRVFEFEVLTSGSTVKRLWTTTCQASKGSLQGSALSLETLFNKQIPDSKKLRDAVDF